MVQPLPPSDCRAHVRGVLNATKAAAFPLTDTAASLHVSYAIWRVIADKLADALGYAWDTFKMVHRDIKPSNIILDSGGEPKLTDFGLSKSTLDSVSHTEAGYPIGTPNFMSPEQIDGEVKLDSRADIYSLGATLYHMLTGELPFEAKTVTATLQRQASEALPDVCSKDPTISKGCAALIAKMTAQARRRAVAERIQSLEDDLARAVAPAQRSSSSTAFAAARRQIEAVERKAKGTSVERLYALSGMPLKSLTLRNCRQLDSLSGLRGLPLETIIIRGIPAPDVTPLRGIKSLKTIRR